MEAELQATCSALGYFEGHRYVKEPDCLECVKDLIRYLKRDDETCSIRRQLGEAKIVQNDLLPVMKEYNSDGDLFDCTTRLLVNLTQPALFCFQNTIPEDKSLRNNYLQIESHLQSYKQKFVDEEFFEVISEKLSDCLKLDWEHRHESDRMLIERLLVLIRNILHIPPNYGAEKRTDDDASVHDQVLWVMNVSGLSDLVVYLASAPTEHQYCIHVLEIVSLMFREQTAENLALASTQRAVSEKEKDKRELDFAREKELADKREKLLKTANRHSRFGGTFVVKNVTSISDRDTIYHKPLTSSLSYSLESSKQPKKRARNRQPITARDVHRRSTLSIRLHLKDFCVQILENSYNPLMLAVKDNLVRERTQENDETYYLWAMRFFMEFTRLYSGRVDLISETMSVETFHYIHTNLLTYYEMILTDKKQARAWSKRSLCNILATLSPLWLNFEGETPLHDILMHLALKAYQELLHSLHSMERASSSAIRDSARVIKSNIFYMMEFRDIFVTLLRKFDGSRQSREYLKDLVESTHLFIKMLEGFKKVNRHMVVEKRRIKRKRPTSQKPAAATNEAMTREQLEDLWDDISTDLSAFCQGREPIPDNIAPFDAASDIPIEQQRVDAMIRIQDSLRNKETGAGLAMLRAAREVWPERGEFGSDDISPEDEFMALREVFMTALPRSVDRVANDVEEVGEEEIVELQVEEDDVTTSEQEFNFREYILKFAKPEILKTYCELLGDFATNTLHTNHCLVKMLHRLAVDHGLVGMLFQLSAFRIFHRILLGTISKLSQMKELVRFSKYVFRKFVEASQKNDLLFVELLFWKNAKEGTELEGGYGSYVNSKTKSAAWSEEQEVELRQLFEEHNSSEHEGKDTVDLILEQLSDQSRSRNQVIRELKRQNLISSAKDLKQKKAKQKPSDVWLEDQEAELTTLFHQYNESNDVIANVMANLSVPRSKRDVVNKILSSGLVADKKDLNKGQKAQKRRAAVVEPQHVFTSAEFVNTSDDSDDDDDNHHLADAVHVSPVTSTKKTVSQNHRRNQPRGRNRTRGHSGHSEANVSHLIHSVVQKGLSGPLSWIQQCLTNAANSRSRSSAPQPVPIVPLTEANEDAMEDEAFQNLLLSIGLAAPADEQEAFWRIPAHIPSEGLLSLSQHLDADSANIDVGEASSLVSGAPSLTSSHSASSDDNSSLDETNGSFAKTTNAFHVDKPPRLLSSGDEDDTGVINKLESVGMPHEPAGWESESNPCHSNVGNVSKKITKVFQTDSEDEGMSEQGDGDQLGISTRRAFLDSDDDDDGDKSSYMKGEIRREARNGFVDDVDDVNKRKRKTKRKIESDDDDGDDAVTIDERSRSEVSRKGLDSGGHEGADNDLLRKRRRVATIAESDDDSAE